jgi:hypothetical protein
MISHGTRWKFAFRAFFSLLFHGRIADDILQTFVPIVPKPVPVLGAEDPAAADAGVAADADDRAAQMLMLLQRGGRLVDFVMEDLGGYADAQIGAAVRDVHAGCRETLGRYVTLAPVLDDEEGARVTLDASTDPARIKLVGNVGNTPQFHGVVRHRGWEVTRLELPPLPSAGRAIVAPAEVEIG